MKPWSDPCTRRAVLAGLAGSALAPLGARTGMYQPLLAAQTSVWLPLTSGPEPALAGMARAGYERVVLDAAFTTPDVAAVTRAALRQHRLTPAMVALDVAWEAMAEAARPWKDAGATAVEVRPAVAADARLEADARRLNQLGNDLERLGLRLIVRSTAATLARDAHAWGVLVRNTEAPIVRLAIDVGAALEAAAAPRALIDAASPRLDAVVLRSRRGGRDLEEIGEGQPDMPRLATALRRMLYDGYLVVDLPPGVHRTQTVAMTLAHSRWYVHQVFGMRPGATPVDMGPHVRTHRQ
jgi:sugar phosphate isomerase/epimerase